MIRRIAFALALSLAVTVAYRFSPPVPDSLRRQHCRVPVPALRGLVDTVNCDSPSFLELAADPERVFTAASRWQSRPLYVLSGTVLGAPFGSFSDDPDRRLRAAYVGFVVFNVLTLAWAIVLFEALLVDSCGRFVTRVLAVTLITNDVVKTSVWSPHLQMLNVLQPLLLAWLIHHVATRSSIDWTRALVYAALAGLAPLFYGSGVLLLPGLIVGFLSRPDARHPTARRRSAALVAAMTAVFVLPVAAWVRLMIATTGSFFSLEVGGYRQFVWIADRFTSQGLGAVAGDLLAALGVFAHKTLLVGGFPLIVLCLAAARAASDVQATRAAFRRASVVVIATLYTLTLNVAFFVTLGYYTERLSLNVVPPLVLLTGVLLAGAGASMTAQRQRLLHGALLCLVLGWTAWQVQRPGPWSFHTTAWRADSRGVHPVKIGRDAISAPRRAPAGCDWPAA